MKIKRRYPNYFTGFDETEHEISSLDDLLILDWIKNWTDYDFEIMYSPHKLDVDYLMAFKMESKTYFVIGYIFGSGKDLGLNDYNEKI